MNNQEIDLGKELNQLNIYACSQSVGYSPLLTFLELEGDLVLLMLDTGFVTIVPIPITVVPGTDVCFLSDDDEGKNPFFNKADVRRRSIGYDGRIGHW